MISITIDSTGIKTLTSQVPAMITRASVRAINRTGFYMRTQVSRHVAETVQAPVMLIRRGIKIERAKTANQTATVGFSTKGIRAHFLTKNNFRPKTPQQQRKMKGSWAGRTYFPGAFVAAMRSGYTSIFRRRGASRLPIKEASIEIEGPVRDAIRAVTPQAENRLRTLMQQELNYELNVKARKA